MSSMSQEGSPGFEQASADAARLASELAEIRKQLTELREQNSKFLATDPVTGKEAPSAPAPQERSSAKPPVAKTIAANAKGAGADATKAPAKEPQMAAAGRSAGATPAAAQAQGTSKPTETSAESAGEAATEQPEGGKKRWWKKQKPEARDTGF
jgi:hypothetical protein